MPKLAGRGVFFAALAVPFAMAVAPLTATAEEPDEAVVTEALMAAGVATPDAAAAVATATTTVETEEAEEAFFPGPEWYGYEQDDAETEDAAVAVAPAQKKSVVDADDYGVPTSDGWAGASYSEVAAAAGPDGAWVDSVESGAVTGNDGYGHDYGHHHGDTTAAWHEETTAAAGSDGAFVESVESAAVEHDGHGSHRDGWDGHDDVTGAYHEEFAAHAGEDGAWVHSMESAAGEVD
jgi:hypothetical protein